MVPKAEYQDFSVRDIRRNEFIHGIVSSGRHMHTCRYILRGQFIASAIV